MLNAKKTKSELPGANIPVQRRLQIRPSMLFPTACVLLSFLSGALSGWWFTKQSAYEFVAVDLKGIVQEKKQELIERYRKTPTDENVRAIDRELTEFLGRLDQEVSALGSGRRVVLIRDAVLDGAVADVTESVKKDIYAHGRK